MREDEERTSWWTISTHLGLERVLQAQMSAFPESDPRYKHYWTALQAIRRGIPDEARVDTKLWVLP